MARSAIPVLREASVKFSALAHDYLVYLATYRACSRRTCECYELAYAQFQGYLQAHNQNDDVRAFNAETCDAFAQSLAAGGLKASSIGTKLAALSSLAQYAMKRKGERGKYLLDENPILRIERPRKQAPRERYLYADELRTLLAVQAPPHERLALAFLFTTNLRASAAASARVRDLSLDSDRVVLTVTEKGNKERTVVLPSDVAESLLGTLKQREAKPEETLLVNASGRAYTRTSLSEMVARLARTAGITRFPVRAHLFARHSPASLAGQHGSSAFEIAALLGHTGTATAQKYVHGVSGEATRERVRALLAT